MIAPKTVIREEPAGSNPELTALDESSQTLRLAEFSVPSVSRYSFVWERAELAYRASAIELLESLASKFSETLRCVAGWVHDEQGTYKIRSRHKRSVLLNAGWRVHTEDGMGIGVHDTPRGELERDVQLAEAQHSGWFVTFGDELSIETLVRDPFRRTLQIFCKTQRLAPSREFLEALGGCGSSVGYLSAGDDRLPTLVLVSARARADL